ncbi:MAG: sedoheptulose 7-phosphate cyclase [bacterium]|nr:sedoheptulose 7-phosphate cyclase [bacterium]
MSRRVRADREREYHVELVDDLLGAGVDRLTSELDGRRALVVTTPTVHELYTSRLVDALRRHNETISTIVLPCDEATKNLDKVKTLCEQAIESGLDRRSVIVGVGGGVCTDLVTMAASWIRRGIDYVRVPTTLMGQVDAGIGIKGAVNFGCKKSYVGTFYPPQSVIVDPAFLNTLCARHVRCGIAEIIKIALACDARLFELIESHGWRFREIAAHTDSAELREIIWLAIVRMLEELEPNLHEDRTLERVADLGHTFSPMLESATGFRMHHGEAVAIDMAISAALAHRMGWVDDASHERILTALIDVGLPVWSEHATLELCWHAIEDAAVHRGGQPNVVLPSGIGEADFVRRVEGICRNDLEAALRAVERRAGDGSAHD